MSTNAFEDVDAIQLMNILAKMNLARFRMKSEKMLEFSSSRNFTINFCMADIIWGELRWGEDRRGRCFHPIPNRGKDEKRGDAAEMLPISESYVPQTPRQLEGVGVKLASSRLKTRFGRGEDGIVIVLE